MAEEKGTRAGVGASSADRKSWTLRPSMCVLSQVQIGHTLGKPSDSCHAMKARGTGPGKSTKAAVTRLMPLPLGLQGSSAEGAEGTCVRTR